MRGRAAGVVLGFVVSAAAAKAQVPLRYDIGAGIAFPSSPGIANQYWDAGYMFSGGTRWRVNSRWSFGIDAGYSRFDAHERGPQPATPPSMQSSSQGWQPGALQVVPILLAGEFAMSDWSNTRPFVGVHAGYVRIRMSEDAASTPFPDPNPSPATPVPSPDSDAFGVGFTLGIRTVLTGSADLVFEAGWEMAFSQPDRIAWVPVRLAMRF